MVLVQMQQEHVTYSEPKKTMPTYVYKREDGTLFELTQKMSEQALKTCPQTGQKVHRVITGGGGVVYKGDGWYVTDYKNKNGSANGENKTPNGSADKHSSDSSASASDNKKAHSEAKPAGKTES